ncbi:MAG: type 4a pilus biogenesis protein PilO [bacterium]
MEQREKYMLIGLVVAAVGAGAYYFVIPMWNQYFSWADEIDENVQRIKEAQRQAGRLEDLKEEVTQTRREFVRARRRLPPEGEFFNLLAQLEDEARNSGIEDEQIRTFSRGSVRDRDMVQVMSIEASFENITLGNLTEVLWRYRNMERLIDIDSISLQKSGEDSESIFSVSLTLNVYILRSEEDVS